LAPSALRIIGTCKDSLGRSVVLTQDRWDHITDGHPEMGGLHLAVMRVVENADTTMPGNFPNSVKFYKEKLGPAKGLVVVVKYTDGQGQVITSYPCSKEPQA
jgi:hypothetical protein